MPKQASKKQQKEWKENILKQRQSGLSIASWCRQHGFTDYVFHYWQKKLFPKVSLNRSIFAEIPQNKDECNKGITLEYQGFNIHLSEYFDPDVLKKCLEVLKKC